MFFDNIACSGVFKFHSTITITIQCVCDWKFRHLVVILGIIYWRNRIICDDSNNNNDSEAKQVAIRRDETTMGGGT